MRLSGRTFSSIAAVVLAGAGCVASPAAAAVRIDLASVDEAAAHASPGQPAEDGLAPDLTARFPGYDVRAIAFGGLWPDLGLADSSLAPIDNERFAQATFALASDLHFDLAEVGARPSPEDLPPVSDLDQLQLSRSAAVAGSDTLLAGAQWNFASWGGLGIAAGETNASPYPGGQAGFGLPGTRFSAMLGVSAHLNFGDGWVTSFSYDEGRNTLDLRPNALAVANGQQDDGILSVDVAKDDIFGGDSLGLDLIRPLQQSANGLAAGNNFSGLLGSQISLSSATPETDFQLDYETSFNGNITLQANAGYQMNVAGQNGTRAVSVLSRAKINF